jgi:hypothetical protein
MFSIFRATILMKTSDFFTMLSLPHLFVSSQFRKERDGIAMGLLLSLMIANFTEYLEEEAIKQGLASWTRKSR